LNSILRLQNLLMFAFISILTGCGSGGGVGGSAPPAGIASVDVMPDFVAIPVDSEGQQFFGMAKDASGNPINGKSFAWSVVGDENIKGSINLSGLYTPPVLLPDSSNLVEIKATILGNQNLEDIATVNLLTGPNIVFGQNVKASSLNSNANSSLAVGNQNVAVFGDFVYLVWADNATGDYDIYLTMSSDRGKTFNQTPIRVNNVTQGDQRDPEIAIDNQGNIYIVWEDDRGADLGTDFDIYFAKGIPPVNSDDFLSNLSINDDTNATRDHFNPTVAVDIDGNVYVAWEDPRKNAAGLTFDIYFEKGIPQSDGSIDFSGSVNRIVNRDMAGISQHFDPKIIVDENRNIYIAWVDNREGGGNLSVFLAKSTDTGINFHEAKANDVQGAPLFPSLAVDRDGNIFLAWEDFRDIVNGTEIFLTKSTDGGITFGPNINVSNTDGDQFSPSLAVDLGGNLYIVWEDRQNGDNDPDVYFVKSMDGGVTFKAGNTGQAVNDDSGNAQFLPSLALDSAGRAFIAWFDERGPCPPLSTSCPALYFAMGQE